MAISSNAISRLSLYRTALDRIRKYGAQKVYSCDIADILGVTAVQVRKDFSTFKFTGRKKVGYLVNQLIDGIDVLLRKNDPPRAVLCGCGPALEFLLEEVALHAGAFPIAAAFDASDAKTAYREKRPDFPFFKLSTMTNYVSENGIKVGIIAALDKAAQRLFDMLVLGGVQGVLNLSNAELKSPKYCIVRSISVLREFERIVYLVSNPAEPPAEAATQAGGYDTVRRPKV